MTRNSINAKDETIRKDKNTETPDKTTNTVKSEDTNSKKKPDPTRYGDWERNGRCIDF